jgi:hypothetical protein
VPIDKVGYRHENAKKGNLERAAIKYFFRPFDARMIAIACWRVINATPFLYSAKPNLAVILACSSFGDGV